MLRTVSTAVLALAMGFAGGAAQAQSQVLEGEQAFGGWKADSPGTVRHITVDALPAAAPETSSANGPAPVARPDGVMPQVPDGFKVELVTSDIDAPRVIRFAPNGDLFVANSQSGEVRVLRFEDGKAEPASEEVFASGLDQPYGIAFYPAGDTPEWVYVAESNGLKRFPYKPGDMTASGEPETLFDNIDPNHHWTRDVAFSPDGETMYYSVGSGSNVGTDGTMDMEPEGGVEAWAQDHPLGVAWGEEERRAAVLAFDPDGSNERYFATGLRNCAGMAVNPASGKPWCVVNERDELGDNVPFEFATSLDEGEFFGWPWYYIGDHADPRWAETPREDLKGQVTVPDVLFQAHSAPLNIAFTTSDAWGSEYKGDAFVAMHGSWNRGTRTGYKVVRLDFDENGKPKGTYEDFVTGMVLADDAVWGRPVGIAFGPDGALYFSEDGSGSIWKVSRN